MDAVTQVPDGFDIVKHKFEVYGYCKDCTNEKRSLKHLYNFTVNGFLLSNRRPADSILRAHSTRLTQLNCMVRCAAVGLPQRGFAGAILFIPADSIRCLPKHGIRHRARANRLSGMCAAARMTWSQLISAVARSGVEAGGFPSCSAADCAGRGWRQADLDTVCCFSLYLA